MKNEQLLEAIGGIRDEWIDEAHSKFRRGYRFPVILAAVLLCMALAVSGLAAADVGPAYELLYAVSPNLAQRLKPVRLSCVDNGIEMEVISAEIDGDTARIFVGLRDLEGDRVDATCDLYDSYDINLPAEMMVGTCAFASFDEETQTALFLVELSCGDGKQIRGDKITFSVREFLTGREEYLGEVDVPLENIAQNPEMTKDFIVRGYGQLENGDHGFDEVMVSDGEILRPTEHVAITAMGRVDGMLRIQVYYENMSETDNHGNLFFVDERGSEIHPKHSVSFWAEDYSSSFDEYVFDISPEELRHCTLSGYFSTALELHKGDWEVTFPLN